MQEFIIITLIVLFLFKALRKFIFFNSYHAFNKAAEDFMKKQERNRSNAKREGEISITKTDAEISGRTHGDSEYVDYEEIK